MPGSSFGQAFRVTTAGESHGPANVVIVDGCPPGIPLTPGDLAADLDRRRPGQSHLVSSRQEPDAPEILSGVHEGHTTGASIAVLVRSRDARSRDYDAIRDLLRPGHADFSYLAKYGRRDHRGGGRASARETVARVCAGAIAKRVIAEAFGGEVVGYVVQIGDICAQGLSARVRLEDVETLPGGAPNPTRCPDPKAACAMAQAIEEARRAKDSLGGVAEIAAYDIPAGLGEPVFDKLKADLARGLMSLPAVYGVELGCGFGFARLRGSEAHDAFCARDGRAGEGLSAVTTRSNRHGGILGGISTGQPIVLRACVKPTSSIARPMPTVDLDARPQTVETRGRHDPCLLPRFVPMAEAMVALVLADHWLRHRGQCG